MLVHGLLIIILLLLEETIAKLVIRVSKLVITSKIRLLRVLLLVASKGGEVMLVLLVGLILIEVELLRHLSCVPSLQEVLLRLLLIILSNTPTYPYRNF